MYEIIDILITFFLQRPSQAAIDLDQACIVYIRQAVNTHHIEKKIEFHKITATFKSARFFKGIGNDKVSVCDLPMVGQVQVRCKRVRNGRRLLVEDLQTGEQRRGYARGKEVRSALDRRR